jgi:hypothetical protein
MERAVARQVRGAGQVVAVRAPTERGQAAALLELAAQGVDGGRSGGLRARGRRWQRCHPEPDLAADHALRSHHHPLRA